MKIITVRGIKKKTREKILPIKKYFILTPIGKGKTLMLRLFFFFFFLFFQCFFRIIQGALDISRVMSPTKVRNNRVKNKICDAILIRIVIILWVVWIGKG